MNDVGNVDDDCDSNCCNANLYDDCNDDYYDDCDDIFAISRLVC